MPDVAVYQFQLLPDLAGNEYDALKADIAINGVLVPVEVDQDGQILDGHHRVRAWHELTAAGVKLLDYPRLVRRFDNDDSRIEHALKLNLQRRHLNRDQLAAIALDLRQRGGFWTLEKIGATLGVSHVTVLNLTPEFKNLNSEDQPKITNTRNQQRPAQYKPRQPAVLATSEREQNQAQKLLDLEDGDDEDDESSIVTINDKRRAHKDAERKGKQIENAALVSGAVGLREYVAGEVFPTIVIDPPWDFGDEGDVDQFGRGRPTYQTMTIDEITDLPINDVSASNAHIYLWITNRSLPKGFALLEAWGFRYVTMLTWCKPSIGMGNYFRGSTEQVLFGVRGSLPLLRNDVGTWFSADRSNRHSAKPAEFMNLVESCSPGPWLDLFARTERSGWVTWGAEV